MTTRFQSADHLLLNVPRTKLKLKGGRAFAAAAPNRPLKPLHIRKAPTSSPQRSALCRWLLFLLLNGILYTMWLLFLLLFILFSYLY